MTERKPNRRMWTVPNILTMVRLVLIGVMVWLAVFRRNSIAALEVYLVAFATDIVDGWIARRFNQVSDVGKMLDPIADKTMTISALASLAIIGNLSNVILIVVVAVKEALMIAGGILIFLRADKVVQANAFGKFAAGCYFLAIVMLFLHDVMKPWDMWFMVAAVAMNMVSIVQYGYLNMIRPLRQRRSAI